MPVAVAALALPMTSEAVVVVVPGQPELVVAERMEELHQVRAVVVAVAMAAILRPPRPEGQAQTAVRGRTEATVHAQLVMERLRQQTPTVLVVAGALMTDALEAMGPLLEPEAAEQKTPEATVGMVNA